MKRSEMVDIIQESIDNMYDNSSDSECFECGGTCYFIDMDKLLHDLENAGMLPPETYSIFNGELEDRPSIVFENKWDEE